MRISALEERVLQHMFEKLASQQSYLINLRNQASISAAISGLVATFFGTLLSGKGSVLAGDAFLGLSLPAIIALTLFSASIAFAAFVVVHTHDFTFSFDAKKMLANLRVSKSDEEFLEKYVSDGDWFFVDNERLISAARSNLLFSLMFGFAQIIPWSILIISVGEK